MSKLISTIPIQDNYMMPAEFAPHLATWMVWPQRSDNWRDNALAAQSAYAELANKISQYETVYMGVSKNQINSAKKLLNDKVHIIQLEGDDAWVRDTGPTCVKNINKNQIRGISWVFNAWGGLVDGLYSSWEQDQLVATKICQEMQLDYYQADFVLEGGSIHTDGLGTLYVTEACLLSKGRNPHLSKQQIENKLKDYLGIKKVIWLQHGIYLDETNEHVDNIIQVGEDGRTILLHWADDQNDIQYEYSKAAFDLLSQETNAIGEKLNVVKVPAPDPLIYISQIEAEGVEQKDGTLPRKAGDRLAASYLNHYVGNGAVYIPKFFNKNDDIALAIIQKAYPSRKVIQIELAREILLGGGNIHCITQQIPK